MSKPHPIKTMAVMLALTLPNISWALWSREPAKGQEELPFSAVTPPPADAAKTVPSFTPPAVSQAMGQAEDQGDVHSLARRLDAGRASEAIEIPLRDKDAAVAGGTFTRIDRKKVGTADEPEPDTSGGTTDTPIPAPASPWLFLFTLPALLLARRRSRT